MNETRTQVLLLMLMGVVILLTIAILGLFLRMNQLQQEVLAALVLFQSWRPEGLSVGTQAPDFKLAGTEGQTISLADLAGQSVLLAFSSTRCPACQEMYLHIKAFSESWPDIQVIMISRGSVEENRQLNENQGFGFPVLTWEDTVASDYQVPGTPFFYVIDEAGVIVGKGFAGSGEQLKEMVKVLSKLRR